MRKQIAFVGFITLVLCLTVAGNEVPFPSEYRTWASVKSVLIGPKSPAFATEAGIHHIYANHQAQQGYETGKFPDGSILVYELLDITEADGITTEGSLKRVDVMLKDSQQYKENGSWRFARFRSGSRADGSISEDQQTACFNCHTQRKDHDFVFSEFRK